LVIFLHFELAWVSKLILNSFYFLFKPYETCIPINSRDVYMKVINRERHYRSNTFVHALYISKNMLHSMEWWWCNLLCTRPTRLTGSSSLKQQSEGRHVAPLGHIILIPSRPVFALSPLCCVLSGEATNTNFIVFGLTRPGLEPTIYHTCTSDAVVLWKNNWLLTFEWYTKSLSLTLPFMLQYF